MKKKTSAKDIDEYLSSVPEEARGALKRLRKTIKAAAPRATEVISYQIAAFKLDGLLVGFAAHPNHCSFYLMSPGLATELKGELRSFEVSGATIHFQPNRPLPASLVKKLVKARIAENQKQPRR
jgi:uncharacterized protein YdhG (YjbR/CyaY superfamily)